MAFRIQDFRSQMALDGARYNLFECNMTFPTSVVQNSNGIAEKFTFMCHSGQIPGSTVNPIPVNYFGREIKFAGNRTFPEWTVTIWNDEDFRLRNAFENWMNGLNQHRFNLRNPSLVNSFDYQQDGYVKQYGKAGDVLKAYKFIGMFPIDISAIDLDWGSNDAIQEYAVTFAYQWWETIGGDQSATQNETVL
jgi:hypothetical protein